MSQVTVFRQLCEHILHFLALLQLQDRQFLSKWAQCQQNDEHVRNNAYFKICVKKQVCTFEIAMQNASGVQLENAKGCAQQSYITNAWMNQTDINTYLKKIFPYVFLR